VLAFGILGDQARAEADAGHAVAIVHTDYVAQVSLLTHLATAMRAVGRGDLVVLVGGRDPGPPRQLRLRVGQGRPGRFRLRLADALHGTGSAVAGAARVRDRPDDERHGSRAAIEHPAQVAEATARALRTGRGTVWVPWALRPMFFGMKLLPRAIWRRLPR
jgi:hypothetical protein